MLFIWWLGWFSSLLHFVGWCNILFTGFGCSGCRLWVVGCGFWCLWCGLWVLVFSRVLWVMCTVVCLVVGGSFLAFCASCGVDIIYCLRLAVVGGLRFVGWDLMFVVGWDWFLGKLLVCWFCVSYMLARWPVWGFGCSVRCLLFSVLMSFVGV